MSSYKKEINQVEKLMQKYKFKEPIPEEVRHHIIHSRKRILKRVLKTLGVLTLTYSLFLSIYFILKKFGIAKVLLSLFVATSVTTGTYVTIKYVATKNKIQPIALHITPKKIQLTEKNIIKDLKIITVLSNNKKNNISLKATTQITPATLAKITVNKKIKSLHITFKKPGKGKLIVQWKKLKSFINISYNPKIKHKESPLTPLQKLYKKYKHSEKILLQDGSVFKGVLIDKGAGNILFITPKATLKLKRSDIIKIEYLTPDKLK